MRPTNSFKKRIRALLSSRKAHLSSEPPRLENLEFLPHNMAFDGIAGVSSDEVTPTTMNGSSPATRTSKLIDMPARQSFANGTRFSSPPPSDADGMRSPSALSSQPGTPTNESTPAWYVNSEHLLHHFVGPVSQSAHYACHLGRQLSEELRLENQDGSSKS